MSPRHCQLCLCSQASSCVGWHWRKVLPWNGNCHVTWFQVSKWVKYIHIFFSPCINSLSCFFFEAGDPSSLFLSAFHQSSHFSANFLRQVQYESNAALYSLADVVKKKKNPQITTHCSKGFCYENICLWILNSYCMACIYLLFSFSKPLQDEGRQKKERGTTEQQ